MSKGKSNKMKCCLCNVLIDNGDINCNSLPKHADSHSIIIVKLKSKAVSDLCALSQL